MSSNDFSQELHNRLAEQEAREQALQAENDLRKQLEEAKITREQEERQQDLLREAELLFAPETWKEIFVEPRYDSHYQRAILRCTFLEHAWYLHKNAKANTWEFSPQYGSANDKAISPENLEQKLLLQLARYQQSEAQRQQAIKDAEQKQRDEQAVRLAAHNELQARLISEQQRLQATLFVWPENLEKVYIYQIRYCKGGGWHGSQKTTVFEYEETYTTTDRLDMEGYIEIQEKNGPQVIKLDAKINKPIWKRLIITETTAFSQDLYESVDAALPNVGNEYNKTDHRYYLTENRQHSYLERRHVGRQPVLWLRQHILAQAAIRTQGM